MANLKHPFPPPRTPAPRPARRTRCPAPDPSTPATAPALAASTPPATAATIAAVAATAPASEPAISWNKIQPDCTVDITDGVVHIQGTTGGQSWRFNGIQSTTSYPAGDFTATVDFKCAKFTGPGNKTVYLRAGSRGGNFAGVYFNPEYFYQLHTWTNPQIHSGTHKVLGDEATNFHTLKLKYEAATKTTTAYVDDDPIGQVQMEFMGRITFGLVANTDSAGMNIDVYFKNFKVDAAPAAP